MKKKLDKRLDIARRMPPRKKKTAPDAAYHAANDEVLYWISLQPELLMYLSDVLARNGLIEYNPVTKAWEGVDYNET